MSQGEIAQMVQISAKLDRIASNLVKSARDYMGALNEGDATRIKSMKDKVAKAKTQLDAIKQDVDKVKNAELRSTLRSDLQEVRNQYQATLVMMREAEKELLHVIREGKTSTTLVLPSSFAGGEPVTRCTSSVMTPIPPRKQPSRRRRYGAGHGNLRIINLPKKIG